MKTDIAIVGGARTPMCEYSGTPGYGKLKDLSAIELGAHAAKAALERAKLDPETIHHVVMGNALQTSADAIYGARHVGLKAGVPQATPALTVNRLCGSGIEAAVQAAHLIRLGEATTVLAGGMENMSQAPLILRGAREGFRFGVQPQLEDLLFAALKDPFCGLFMAQTAEKIAKRLGLSRAAQDEFALRSHRLGAAAVKEGRFAEEIAPIKLATKKGELVIDSDDHIRPDTTLEGLAKLNPAFGKDGTVTAGNASGIVDGAAALLLTTAERAKSDRLDVFAFVRASASVGVDPSEMGIGPVPAIRKCLERAGVKLADVDLFEINEAFAAQYLGCEKELGLQRERVNVNGGAISLGHPLGATGARLILTLMLQLRRSQKRYGVASACIGGGQGIAILLENPRA
ncbi:MAG: acetyl-CoA C-acetyltransferase [Planctomycetes bacterium]|nr:acetyl-CoA C-acetyltransferase [Planctomycetota bacterium]